ncbi:hypothetical protein [Proteiniphilum sp. UBA5384]|uniref:hypothetical protein n=1 Tax=Proteiniphilum sp. UBA5384 TaxID=1947279 RepID=UPI0025CE1D76|nr:hypothetical protein [Proteiniphilum sp. UBA5384]
MKYLLLMMFSVLLWSCNKEDDPFSGDDNYIVSFSLVNEGQTIKAMIVDDTIVVNAPVDFQLINATAEVKMSENSSIKPNPATITDWSSEYLFVITSYNGKTKSYRYKVENSGLNENSSVLLTTQEEVEAFGARGITSINGNLIIGTASGIETVSSLEPLNKLKEVSQSVIIKGTFSGETLGGLTSLEKIGGLLRIETSGLKEATFPALKSAMHIEVASKSLESINCPKLTEMSGNLTFAVTTLTEVMMPKLRKVEGEVFFSVPVQRDPTALETIIFPALEEVGGRFGFGESNLLKSISLPALRTAGKLVFGVNSSTPDFIQLELPKLERCEGDVTFHQLAAMTDIVAPMLTYIGGDLTANYCNTEKIELPKLETVKGDINLLSIGNLNGEGLKGFGGLKSLDGTLNIRASLQTNMTELLLPAQLKKIGTLAVWDINSLTTLNLTGVEVGRLELQRATLIGLTVKGDVVFNGDVVLNGEASITASRPYEYSAPTFSGIKQIRNLELQSIVYFGGIKIEGLTKINGDVIIRDNSNMKSFEMHDVTEIAGDILTEMCGGTTDRKLEFASVTKVGGIRVGEINSYYGFSGEELSFPNLTTAKNVCLKLSGNVKNISMPKLETITDTLRVAVGTNINPGNTALINFDGLAKLTSVKYVHIEKMKAITSFEGLKNCLPVLTDEGQWKMIDNNYNPTLADMKAGKWDKQ